MKVIVHLLTWDGIRYLPALFASLDAQTHQDFELRIVDNGSKDGTVEYLREHRSHNLIGCHVRNMGFAAGHNALMRFTLEHLDSDPANTMIILLNQDIILQPDTIARFIDGFTNPQVGSVQPKLFRAFGEPSSYDDLQEVTQSDILDSTGLTLHRDWRFYDRGMGEMDHGQFDQATDILGPNGALPAYRLSALNKVAPDGEIFDKDYFSYREDIDLALSLRRAGFLSVYAPAARAHHYRGMYGGENLSLWQRFTNRRRQRPFASALSLRNEIYTLIKHLSFRDAVYYAPWLSFHLFGRMIYGFIFEKQTRRELLRIPGVLRTLIDKRRKIKEKTTIDLRDLRQYVSR